MPSQVAVPFADIGQAEHEPPQLDTEVFETHCEPQRWKPGLQVKSQVVPEQTGLALAGVEHAAHTPEQSWKPGRHEKPHAVPLQVGAAPAGTGQATHDEVPQLATSVFETQRWPHGCWPAGQLHTLLEHEAPLGHSEGTRHPGWQVRVTGSHE